MQEYECIINFDSKNIGPRNRILKRIVLPFAAFRAHAKMGISPRKIGIDQFNCIFPVKLLIMKKTIIKTVG